MTPDTLAAAAMPPVPLSVEGASVLHQMMRFRRPAWRSLSPAARQEILLEASSALAALERPAEGRQSALFSVLGHKGDIMFVHFRRSFEELNQAQLDLARLAIGDFLEPTTSYLSIVELGIYESPAKVYGGLLDKGIQPYSNEWKQEIEATLDRHRQAMAPRLWPEIPPTKYAVITRKMPPWPADPHFGKFSNDRSLSREEIDTLVAWADGGAREGDPSEAPKPAQFVDGWGIHKPDAVFEMPNEFAVPASGTIDYQYIVIPSGFTEDKWVQEIEARPGNRQLVHHIIAFIRPPGSKWLKDAQPGIPFVP